MSLFDPEGESIRLWGALRRYEQRLALLEGDVRRLQETLPTPYAAPSPDELRTAEEKRAAEEKRIFEKFHDKDGNMTEAGLKFLEDGWMND